MAGLQTMMTMLTLVAEWSALAFRWGSTDCCQFAGAMAERYGWGYNPMAAFAYGSQREALEVISSFGSLEAAARETMGEPSQITNGSVVLVEIKGDHMMGFVHNDRCLVKTKTGITDWPLGWALIGWNKCHKQ